MGTRPIGSASAFTLDGRGVACLWNVADEDKPAGVPALRIERSSLSAALRAAADEIDERARETELPMSR